MKGFPTSADIYLELDGRKIAVISAAAALHDIGKIAIPDQGSQVQQEYRGLRRE